MSNGLPDISQWATVKIKPIETEGKVFGYRNIEGHFFLSCKVLVRREYQGRVATFIGVRGD